MLVEVRCIRIAAVEGNDLRLVAPNALIEMRIYGRPC
jgi:hypothetical protein